MSTIKTGVVEASSEVTLFLKDPEIIKAYTLQLTGAGTVNVYASLNGTDFALVDSALVGGIYTNLNGNGLLSIKLENTGGSAMTYILNGSSHA